MADDKPYVLVQVGRSPSSRRRTVSIDDRLVELMVSVYATDGDLTAMLRLHGIIGDDEYVLQFGPLRDGKPVSVAQPYPGPFTLAEDVPPGPSPLEVLERRVAALEAQPDRYRIAGRLRLAARERVPRENYRLQCELYAIANELDGGRPDVRRPDWTALRERMEANPADSLGPDCRCTGN